MVLSVLIVLAIAVLFAGFLGLLMEFLAPASAATPSENQP